MKIILQLLLSSILASLFLVFISFADDHGKIIKERKSLFKQNYSHAKKMSAEIAKGNNDKVIELSEKMSANYDKLIDLFPDNSKTGYDTEALPTIWLQKDEFNALMTETSDKVKKFAQSSSNASLLKLFDWLFLASFELCKFRIHLFQLIKLFFFTQIN